MTLTRSGRYIQLRNALRNARAMRTQLWLLSVADPSLEPEWRKAVACAERLEEQMRDERVAA